MFFFVYNFARRVSAACLLISMTACGSLLPASQNDDAQNALVGLLALAASSCASFNDSSVVNPLFTGGTRTLYQVSGCDVAGWSRLGFASDGTTQLSDPGKTVADQAFAGFGTNIEVTFFVTSSAGTLDVMAYGTGTFPGASTTNPTFRIVAGAACSLQFRHSATGAMNNLSTCTDTTTLTAGREYTYCLEFDRGTASSGAYTGFGNMLSAWSRPCNQVQAADRDAMGDLKFMQMMNIPTMNPAGSSRIGFSASGISIISLRVGNTIYSSMM